MTDRPAILFEDPHCVVVVKPAGVLTQGRPSGEPTLEDAVRRHLDPKAPASLYLGTVHRLDRVVSGVVVWAKTPKAARRLSEEFASRRAEKLYWAVVEGNASAAGPDGLWDDWLSDVDEHGVARVVPPETAGARRALTRLDVGRALKLPPGTTWLRFRPESGRTHQLRAQAALRGWPILGDTAYGATRTFSSGIALHARALTVRHPILRTALTWVAPLADSWREAGIELPEDNATA